MNNKKVLVIIPVINELANLKILIPKIFEIKQVNCILIIDDGSSDMTDRYFQLNQNMLADKLKYIKRETNFGIGSAHIFGLTFAAEHKFDIAITMDGDTTHEPKDIYHLLNQVTLAPELDLIIGSRFVAKNSLINWSRSRIALTNFGHIFTKIFLNLKFDASSGLRLYQINTIPIQTLSSIKLRGYEFFPISVYMYKKLDKNIYEIPVQLTPRAHGYSKMNVRQISHSLKFILFFLVKYRVKEFYSRVIK